MSQSSQEPVEGVPQTLSSAIPHPYDDHGRDLDAVVAGGAKQPESAVITLRREWYEWPFSKEAWMLIINAFLFVAAVLIFGGPGLAVMFWVTVIYWVVLYGIIWTILLNH